MRQRSLIVPSLGPRAAEQPAAVRESEGCPGFRLAWPPRLRSLSTLPTACRRKGEMHTFRGLSPQAGNDPRGRTHQSPLRGARACPSGPARSRGPQHPRGRSRDSSAPLLGSRCGCRQGWGSRWRRGRVGPRGPAEGGRGPRWAPGPGHTASRPRQHCPLRPRAGALPGGAARAAR